jgi:hypothetical protein
MAGILTYDDANAQIVEILPSQAKLNGKSID